MWLDISLIKNNAYVGARIAAELSSIQKLNENDFMGSSSEPSVRLNQPHLICHCLKLGLFYCCLENIYVKKVENKLVVSQQQKNPLKRFLYFNCIYSKS